MKKIGIGFFCIATLSSMQKRNVKAGIVVIASSFLSACLESDKPLLKAADGIQWLDQKEFYAMELNSSFVPKKKSQALRPLITHYKHNNQSWQGFSGQSEFNRTDKQFKFNTSSSSKLIFQSLSNPTDDAVVVQNGSRSVYYGFARKLEQQVPQLSALYTNTFDYIVVSSTMSPFKDDVAALRESGIAIESRSESGGHSYVIDSAVALEAIIELLKPRFLSYGNNLAKYGSVHLIAQKPETKDNMVAVSNAIECISRAGHRNDPALELISDFAFGSISTEDINLHDALPVCEAAFASREKLGVLSNSVIYTLSRIKQKSGDLDAALALFKLMKDDESGLSVVGAASVEAVRAFKAGKSSNKAMQLLDSGLSTIKAGSIAEYNIQQARGSLLSSQIEENETQSESRKVFRYLADNGFQQGMLYLARQLKQGTGGPQNTSEARALYLQLIENKMPEAYTDLGLAAYNGELGFVKNYAMAADLFDEGLDIAPTAFAFYLKGFMQMYGQGVSQDVDQGFENLYQSHRRGHVAATTEIGLANYHGHGTEKNTTKAIKLLTLAGEQGDAKATQQLQQLRESEPQHFPAAK